MGSPPYDFAPGPPFARSITDHDIESTEIKREERIAI